MKKKLLALLLSGAMILSLTTPVALAEEPEGESCGSCGQVECVCPPEEAPCEVCGEIECECEKIEELPEEEVPGAAAPEIPEEPTACEICGEIECVCEKIEEPEVPEVPEEPTNDYAELYEVLMNCESIEEMYEILVELSSEERDEFFVSLTTEEYDALDKKVSALENEAEQEEIKEEIEEEDTREIVYHVPTVDFTDAAPFLDPVEGVAKRMMMFAAPRAATPTRKDAEGLETDKYVDAVEGKEDEYVLTLESWATGAKTTVTQEKNVPTDIVLVLDQSGSMDYSFTSTNYRATSGTPQELYNKRNNLYVKLADNTYSPVTVSRASKTVANNYSAYFGETNYTYYNNSSNLYHKCGDTQYGKVTVTRAGQIGSRRYTYTCANCGVLGGGAQNDSLSEPSFANTLYRASTTNVYEYTFTYEKADETTETATVLASASAPAWDFYESYAGGNNTTRLDALKTAVTTFANQVATKAKGEDGVLNTDDDVDHTISVVGFANYSNNDDYKNTEVFVGGTGYKYGTAAQGQYANAPQDMSTTAGVANVTASINALDGDGATYIDLGIEMANGILNANPVPSGEKRNRVVIIFTDGIPGYSGDWGNGKYESTQRANATTVANEALPEANKTKNTYGATVYTVGIFEGADATDTTLPTGTGDDDLANRFMHLLSSNYPNSTGMDNTGTTGTTMPNTGYYLSASDSSALNSIFRTISENIENGGSSITLDENAVVKDVITDQFVLPEGVNSEDTSKIKVYTADYTEDGFDEEPDLFSDAKVSISEDGKTISVSNFDFADNWVGTETAANGSVTYRGKKLIIRIPIEVREGFLGGNGVLTNAAGSGVYENADANTSLEDFESPDVDVKIKPITITAPNYNVYLAGGVPSATLIAGLTVKSGDVVLNMNPTADNYGLEPWQNAYVKIDDLGLNGSGTGLKEDATYTATVTISPLPGTTGAAVAQSNSGSGNIKVFKPYVTVTATDIWSDYGVNVDLTKWGLATENSDTLAMTTEWKNSAGQLSTAEGVKMTGDAPAIEEATFTFDIGTDGIYKTTEANVDVNVTGMTCTVGSVDYTVPADALTVTQVGASDDHDFTIHINHFTMTITKDVGDSKEIYHQDFIFDVVSETGEKFQVVIHGKGEKTIKGLVCGKTYDVYENGEWSWRYSADGNDNFQDITIANSLRNDVPEMKNAPVAFKNKQNIFTWLSGNDFLNNRKKRGEV